MTRIVLRPIGSPLPLGFFTVAIDNVLVSTLQWGVLPAADGRAVALLMEDSHRREVLPIGRTGAARQALHGNLDVELRGIERQPGVRRTL